MATILDGKALAAKCKEAVKKEAESLQRKPGLAVIIVGNNPASRVYVNSKRKDCEDCGFLSEEYAMPEETTQEELITLIETLNGREDIDGILCQLPLPKGIDEEAVLMAISPEKDVDGFHPMNMGSLLIGKEGFLPCTPYGIMEILKEYDIDPHGKHCVVVGRSNIVGKPMSLLLLRENCTVTLCHSRTKNLAEHVRRADVVICAVGRPGLVTGEMIKPGATVIDVGINRLADGRVVGDADFESVSAVAGAITPVPGGVGPMTIAMLMKNAILAAERL